MEWSLKKKKKIRSFLKVVCFTFGFSRYVQYSVLRWCQLCNFVVCGDFHNCISLEEGKYKASIFHMLRDPWLVTNLYKKVKNNQK
jgi:hypothetical protein